jgi:hypothetical protein
LPADADEGDLELQRKAEQGGRQFTDAVQRHHGFKLEMIPIAYIGATPSTCANAWYPRQDPLSYGDVAYTSAGDFTGYWDNQSGFTEFGLLDGLRAGHTLNLGTRRTGRRLPASGC